jgi:hypothetical protein
MSIGASGRVVIEVSPQLKRELYAALALDGVNLKGWFLRQAEAYLSHRQQHQLEFEAEPKQTQVSPDLPTAQYGQ